MKTKFFTLLLAVAAGVGTMFASTKIGDLYYNLDATNQTAEVSTRIINVDDNSIADWNALPVQYVAQATCPADAAYTGLKSVKVYADEVYINILVEYDPEEIPNRELVPFHVFINTDNSDATGGYGDMWNDANVDILMEGFFFAGEEGSGTGEACAYEPVIVPWTGEVGGTGWGWGNVLVPAAPCVASQHVAGKYVEIQMLRELIPTLVGWNNSEFGIGVEIEQSWESVGILPCVSSTNDNPNGKAAKLQVTIDHTPDAEISGDIVVPETVNYDGVTYSVTSIGDRAFSGCSDLTSIEIPNSVTSIGESAFQGCSGLTSVIWNAKNCSNFERDNTPFYEIRSQVISFTFGNDVEHIPAYLCSEMTNLTSMTIPNSVTSIGNSAFSGCSGLTSVTIPNSVTSIGNSAFSGCSGLTSVTIPNSVTSIGNSAFSGCSGLTSVTIPNSVTSIGNNAFEDCSGLTSVTIPNSVTSIGEYVFAVCPSLTSVVVEKGNSVYDSRNNCNAIIETATNTLILGCQNTIIPNSVTSIGEFAFYWCPSLTSVTIPNSVTSIGNYAFYWCPSLTSITIPNSVTSIGEYAFAVCPSLTSVTVGNSVTSIGDYAFYLCSGLTSIYNYSPAPQVIDNEVFGGEEFEQDGVKYGPVDKSLCKLYVPQESINFYKVALIWRDFKNILPIESSDQAIDQVDSSSLQGGDRGRLILRNNQILILRGDKIYTLQGQEVK